MTPNTLEIPTEPQALPSNFYQGYRPGTAPNGYQGGTVPITVEPLNEILRNGLREITQMDHGGLLRMSTDAMKAFANDPTGIAEQYISPGARAALGNMGAAIGEGTRRLTGDDIDRYMNPYTDDVIDASVTRLTEAGERAKKALLAGQGTRGARSFGDTAHGVALGDLSRELVSKEADIASNLRYQGFENARNQFNTEGDRFMTGAGLYGNQAGLEQDVFNSGVGNAGNMVGSLAEMADFYARQKVGGVRNAIGAGQYIQDYNQGVANQVGGEIDRRVGMIPDRLSGLANALGQFQPTQYDYVERPGTLQKAGSAAGSLANLATMFL